MKRTKKHVLEKESRLALRNFLPSEWIIRDISPDYGLDLEIKIVEGEEVTKKALWVQLKATEKRKSNQEKITYSMKNKHLKYYESCNLPVIIIYWIKSENSFYCLFAQRYLKEVLSKENFDWREQKTATITFNSKLETPEELKSIATDGYFYVFQEKLNIGPEKAIYWLDGIPQSDDNELKERTLKALLHLWRDEYHTAIDEFEDMLRELVLSPVEKMSVLLNLGNAYLSLSQNNDALKNYGAILKIAEKVSEESALQGTSSALGNIGLVYYVKGELDKALRYHEDALKIDRDTGYRKGEANALGNIGLVYYVKGELDKALRYYEDALKIDRDTGYRKGEGSDLGNIGLIYRAKGELDKALKYYEDALKIDREIGYRQGEANDLRNIGNVYYVKRELDKALKYLEGALKIDRDTGYRKGEANDLCSIGIVYSLKRELDKALKYLEGALKIDREIEYRKGEASDLGNIGNVYNVKRELDKALKYFKDALKIYRDIGYRKGEAIALRNIGLVYYDKGELDKALMYLEDAKEILIKFKLIYGKDIIENTIKKIRKKERNR